MKRLRKYYGDGIRFFQCGEYGEVCLNCHSAKMFCQCGEYRPSLGRPHFHACLFNHDFDDKYFWTVRNGNRVYRSPELERLWPNGNSEIGDVTFDSAAYVARYVTKKITGDPRLTDAWYGGRRPEFITMSRRPGIGAAWYEKFKGDVFPDDFIVEHGVKMSTPKFYRDLLEKQDGEMFAVVKARRERFAMQRAGDVNNLRNLCNAEFAKLQRIRLLKRGLEETNA